MSKINGWLLLLFLISISCEKDEVLPEAFYQCQNFAIQNDPSHPKAEVYTALVNGLTGQGLPGIMMTVHDHEHGYWAGASGMADIASGIALKPCHITRVGSTVKTFTAVSIFLLQEDGLLSINEPVSKYLTQEEIAGLKNADHSTIRQLLQHSSGIYNYIQNLKFQTASLNDLTRAWHADDLLDYARGQDAYFAPGENVLYSNTNYILLGMIIEKVTGRPFYDFFQERIFKPLGMNFTTFAATDPVPDGIIRGYVDFYSNLNTINATNYSGWDYFTADGGLISNANDLTIFLTSLFNGQILLDSSLTEMMNWQEPKENASGGFKTYYGLGIFRIDTEFGPAYLHSGDAIGYFATMAFFPNQNVTISWAVNGNYGKLDQFSQSKEAMENIFDVIMK